ncbi:hypothetical protein R5W23_002472 [Gemmata sp. JC673]|uniref:Uncharacterized protein n=1 Tax=Gemmata algarum TaxID=2975278 RepID=A0ABU5F3C1_9BACT|nr:hypothetical protein [Gemmata algarum]MDY3561210.1 hypothetical protein [Gemmata algarum]
MRFALAGLLCSLTIGAALSTAPVPKAGPTRGLLAVTSNTNGNWEIYLVQASTGAARRLTDNTASDTEPVWSPDGKRLAFTSDRAGEPDVWLMNADGTEPEQLTRKCGGCTSLRWSPDGKRIAFTGRQNGIEQVMAVEVATGKVSRLTDGTVLCRHASWSPDGKKLSFGYFPGRYAIYTATAEGKELAELTDKKGGLDAAWAPNGQQLAFMTLGADGGWQVFVIGADGKNKKQLTKSANNYGARYPLWSPDGNFISFAEIVDGKLQVAVMRADGSDPKVITSKHEHTLARWSPDGKSLSYVRSEKGQLPALWVSDIDGGNAKELLGGVGTWAAEWKPK